MCIYVVIGAASSVPDLYSFVVVETCNLVKKDYVLYAQARREYLKDTF